MNAPAATINGDRLQTRLASFAAIGATPGGGVNRQALSPEDRAARTLLASLAIERGFTVHQDPMANLFIRRTGRNPDLPPLLIGSHLDSQISGGRFDGALGVLAAFECLETLEDEGVETERSVEVVAWTNEEGSRFAPGAMGSSAFVAGTIAPDWQQLTDAAGVAFEDERRATLAALAEAEMRPLGFPIAGYIELHIEQGPLLEREAVPIGVVTGIQGTRWLEITFTGQTAHAGTTARAFRRDPLEAATEALHALYGSIMPGDTEARFTVGKLRVEPGAVNAIPERVVLSVDLRHPLAERIDAMEAEVSRACEAAAARCACSARFERSADMAPVSFAPAVITAIEAATRTLGVASRRIISGAFHDALYLARVAPSGMIFVPCRDGLSHNEAEYVEPIQCQTGAEVLFKTVQSFLTGRDSAAETIKL
jgi:N-carbamoyl-L-amino-acid hydrolase